MSTVPTEKTGQPRQARLQPPEGFVAAGRLDVTINGEGGKLTRFRRTDGRNHRLGGEHLSTIHSAGGMLKGLTWMNQAFADGDLPSRERAREVAMRFLNDHAPDLLEDMQISWIEPHDETIRIGTEDLAKDVTLTGMKVKCRNGKDGRWFWVIVGAGDEIMAFERDVVWITMPGHRQTEKWLHDDWLAAQGTTLAAFVADGGRSSTALRAITPEGSAIPGISPAMVVENGRLMFLSGHVPLQADGTIVPGNLEEQLTQSFENLLATLRAAGSDRDNIARITLYIRDYTPAMLETIRRVRDRYLGGATPPASALIGVAALFHPEAMVEIDAVAVVPSQ